MAKKKPSVWASELAVLLDRADDAVVGSDGVARSRVIRELRMFCRLVPVELMPLYTIASETVISLGIADLMQALEAIHARTKELEEVIGMIEAVKAAR